MVGGRRTSERRGTTRRRSSENAQLPLRSYGGIGRRAGPLGPSIIWVRVPLRPLMGKSRNSKQNRQSIGRICGGYLVERELMSTCFSMTIWPRESYLFVSYFLWPGTPIGRGDRLRICKVWVRIPLGLH